MSVNLHPIIVEDDDGEKSIVALQKGKKRRYLSRQDKHTGKGVAGSRQKPLTRRPIPDEEQMIAVSLDGMLLR